MSALADALVAAQSRAVAALGKQYVGGQMDGDTLRISLDSIGCSDPSDTEQWIAALDVIRETGAPLPRENGSSAKTDEPATSAQLNLITRLATERTIPLPTGPFTKAQAHEIIDTLKAGTYDAGKWAVPFL